MSAENKDSFACTETEGKMDEEGGGEIEEMDQTQREREGGKIINAV